jgi:hypothetical protein
MRKEGWILVQVIEASLEAFRIFRDYYTGVLCQTSVPLWLPLDYETKGSVLYWEPSMMDEERPIVFHDMVISEGSSFWKELCVLSGSSLSNQYGRRIAWSVNQVLSFGAAMLARGLREDQRRSRLVVGFSREGLFGRELELRTRIFPNTVRWHSLLGHQ